MMTICHFDAAQRSADWHKNRGGRVTGSRAGAILGLSPYQTAMDVMSNMLNPKQMEDNPALLWGRANESTATESLEFLIGEPVRECGLFVNDEQTWLAASPDGLISDDQLAEIKCPYGIRNDKEPVFKTAAEQPHYYCQMQLEMFCSGRTGGVHFYQWTPHGTQYELVEFDPAYIVRILPVLKDFYLRYLASKNLPAKLIEDADNYKRISAEIKDLEQIKKELLAEILEQTGDMELVLGSHKLQKVERAGSVDYKKVPELEGVDLEPYRKKSTVYWKLG